MMIGYLAVRSVGGDESAVATRAAVVGVIAAINIDHQPVGQWWADRTLHQQSSITDGKLEDWTLFTMFLGIVVWASSTPGR